MNDQSNDFQLPKSETDAGINGDNLPEFKGRELEQRFRQLFDNHIYGYGLCDIVKDRNGKVIDFIPIQINKALENLIGVASDSVIGRRLTHVFPASANSPLFEKVGTLISSEKSGPFEFWSTVLGRWLEISVFSPEPGKFAATFADITDRKQAQEMLQKSQREYRDLVENVNDVLYRIDRNGIITYVSPVAKRVLGYDQEELIGRPYFELLYPDDIPSIMKSFLDVINNKLYPSEFRVVTRSGEIRWVRTSSRPIKEAGEVTGLQGVLVDITQNRRVEEALRDSEQFNRVVIEHSPVGISIRNKTGNLISCNRAWQKIFNKSDDEVANLKNKKSSVLTFGKGDEYLREWHSYICQIYEKGGYLYIPEAKLLYYKEGGTHWVSQYFYAILDQEGVVDRVVILTEDITERRRATTALIQSENQYRLLIENAGEVIANIDRQGIFQLANKSAANFFGGVSSDFLGKSITEIFPIEGEDMYKNGILRVFETGKAFLKEGQYTIQGKLRWFRTNLQPVFDSDGKVASVLIISNDISIEKEVEIRNNARLLLLQNLRIAKDIDECLKIGCWAIFSAELYKRAVFTLHNKDRKIVNIGQMGLDETTVMAAREAPAPSIELARRITQEKFRMGQSYFIPVESGIFSEPEPRRIAQNIKPSGLREAWNSGDELFIPLMDNDGKIEGWLSVDTPFDCRRPDQEQIACLEEFVDITSKRIREIQSLEMLRMKSQALEDKNTALKAVWDHIQDEIIELKQKIGANIAQVLMPALEKLVRKDGNINNTYLNLLKTALPELVSASTTIIQAYARLSPREREICNMIKAGSTSKEISTALNISEWTVKKHREFIRKKLGLVNKKTNLEIYLKSN